MGLIYYAGQANDFLTSVKGTPVLPKRFLTIHALLLVCCAAPIAGICASSSGTDAFRQAVAAFQAGKYREALVDFGTARRQGINNPQLTYDLGVTYYRLGRYPEAQREFTALVSITPLAALAHYNLGLVAMRQHERVRARAEFNNAYLSAGDSGLRDLASEALAKLGTPSPAAPRWSVFGDASFGYDSNVALTSESTVLTPAHRGSSLYSLTAGAIGQASGTSEQGWQIVGTFYRVDYPQVSQFDQSYLHFGGQYRWKNGNWSPRLGLYAGTVTLGGADFENLVTFSADTRMHASAGNVWRAFYRYTRIRGSSEFDYLTGWHQSLGVEDTLQFTHADLTFGYAFDFNERNNFNSSSQFLSASPTDNGLYAVYDWHINDTLDAFWEADYQHSHYQGADTVIQNGALTEAFREENWWSTALGLRYAWSSRWAVRIAGRFTDNRSNIIPYSYHSNQILFSLEYFYPR